VRAVLEEETGGGGGRRLKGGRRAGGTVVVGSATGRERCPDRYASLSHPGEPGLRHSSPQAGSLGGMVLVRLDPNSCLATWGVTTGRDLTPTSTIGGSAHRGLDGFWSILECGPRAARDGKASVDGVQAGWGGLGGGGGVRATV